MPTKKKKESVVTYEEDRNPPIQVEIVEVPVKKLFPTVSIAPTRENEREITVSIVFHAPSLADEDLELVAVNALADAKKDVQLALESAVKQEQRWLDATRR